MEKLPTKIITYTMQFLPLEDLNSCSLVCKKWYSALLHPLISSRLLCLLDLHDDSEKAILVAGCARKRLIKHLSIYESCPSVWSGKESMLWMHICNKFEMITTLRLGKLSDKKLGINMLMSIATIFTNVKIVELCSSILFEALDDTAKRQEVLLALDKISQLYLVIEGRNFGKLPRLLDMKLNIRLLSTQNKFVHISRSLKDEIGIKITDGRGLPGDTLSLNSFREVCTQLRCALYLEYVIVNLPQRKLLEILEEMGRFPELKVKDLKLGFYLPSTMNDQSQFLHQISKFAVNHLMLYSRSNVLNWLSREFLSSVILTCKYPTMITCFETFNKTTLRDIFSLCPFTESVHVSRIYNQGSFLTNCGSVTVKYRKAYNGHLKSLRLSTESEGYLGITFPHFLSVVPSHLQNFYMTVESKINDPNILSKLSHRCPNLRKLTILFETKGKQHIFEGRMEKLEELELLNCVNNVVGNMFFPCLNRLKLWFENIVSRGEFLAIAYSFRRIKFLNLLFWIRGSSNDGLKEGLAVLTHLEELRLHLSGNVNSTTFERLSFLSPSLINLTLDRRDDSDFIQLVTEYENMHPHVKVILV